MRRVDRDGAAWFVGPARREGGSPDVVGAVALATACRALETVGSEALVTHERALLQRVRSGLTAILAVRVARVVHADVGADFHAGDGDGDVDGNGIDRQVGIVAFDIAGWDPAVAAAVFSTEHGIGVRDGGFCAHLDVERLVGGDGCGASRGLLRASVGVGTTTDDVERLLAAVDALVSSGPRRTNDVVDGRPRPVGDPRPRPRLLPAPG